MAGWISSKLKVAENFLHQIDQQAAESLGKGDRPPSPSPLDGGDGALRKKVEPVPVKLQLHKKPPDQLRRQDWAPRLPGDPNSARNPPPKVPNSSEAPRASVSSMGSAVSPGAAAATAAMDGDWTTLLSSSVPISPVAGAAGGSSPSPRSARKVGAPKRRTNSKPGKDIEAVHAGGNEQRLLLPRDGGADSSVRHSGGAIAPPEVSSGSPGSPNSVNVRPLWESPDDVDVIVSEPSKDMNEKSRFETTDEEVFSEGRQGEMSVSKDDELNEDKVTVLKGHADADSAEINNVEDRRQSSAALQSSPTRLLSRISSRSSGSSESDSESTSTSDSEYESERKRERRKRRERILEEKAAVMAADAIKERENLVARLEGEKESLEKVLEERQKQQAQEASELQMSMKEAMEAVELEKQKHNSTRMEALARLAELETRNAELARSLATAQWDLEVEVHRVVDLRGLIDSKELVQEELRRKVSNIHQNALSSNHMDASEGGEYEHKLIEAEISFICDKIMQLKQKARSLERNIEVTKELVHPTEVEIELKKRLEQLTDNLIQKQAQVESLSSEKATLLFRIETISRLLEENGISLQSGCAALNSDVSSSGSLTRVDIEAGTMETSYLTLRPLIRDKFNSGGQQLGPFLRQLDVIFASGSVFLRKNPMAQLWSLIYLICLHLWVIYILMSHSQTSDVGSSGAVFSLQNINNTGS